MWPLVDEKPDWMSVNRHLQDEIWRCPGLDSRSDNPIVVGVDQSFIQVQHQHLLSDHVETVSRDGGEWGYIIADSFMLLNLIQKTLKIFDHNNF